MTVTYQREELKDLVGNLDLERLLHEHWAEIEHFKDIPLDVDWAAYRAIEAAGKLRIYSARRDGRLIGYTAYFVGHPPRYRNSLQAAHDVLFIERPERRAKIGHGLIRYSEQLLAQEGVQVIYQSSNVAHPWDALLTRLGYEPVDNLWGKRLNRS